MTTTLITNIKLQWISDKGLLLEKSGAVIEEKYFLETITWLNSIVFIILVIYEFMFKCLLVWGIEEIVLDPGAEGGELCQFATDVLPTNYDVVGLETKE